MNGVEILAEEIVYKFQPFNLFFWLGIIVSIPFLLWLWRTAHRTHELDVGLIIISLVLVFTIGLVCGVATMATPLVDREIRYIKYQVIIDDSVSMNEFLDHYEILSQNGKIYTVKERERK
jgi:hypothetical protein